MSSVSFARLIAEFPTEAAALLRLRRLLKKRGEQLTFEQLVDRLRPSSAENLARILAKLTVANRLTQRTRVYSRRNGIGIEDFESLAQVPDIVYDERADESFAPRLDDTRQVFKVV